MFNKVFKRGKGKATGVDYLLSPKDAQKKIRNPPALLMRGDPNLTKRIIHDLPYAQRYTSGVLSWEEHPDQISEETLQTVMDSFERMVGAGIDADRLNWLWVLHRDKNRVELHWVIPNCDLQSGKRFAPYYDKADRGRFRAWERYTNALHGFSDPADPAKARNLRFPSELPREKANALDELHAVITGMVAQGVVNSRNDIVHQLQSAGFKINRQAEEYISIMDGTGRKLRLRGAFYESTFTTIESLRGTKPSHPEESDSDRMQRTTQLRATLEQELEKRLQYIKKRFPPSQGSSHHELVQSTTLASMPDVDVNDDRSAKPTNAVAPKARERIAQARGTSDNAIRRTLSTLGNVEQISAAITSGLAAIEQKFGAFLKRAGGVLRELGRKINQSGLATSATHSTKTLLN